MTNLTNALNRTNLTDALNRLAGATRSWTFDGARGPRAAVMSAYRTLGHDDVVMRVNAVMTENADGDLIIEITTPRGYSHITQPIEAGDGVRVVVAEVGADNCPSCAEHFSEPHQPGCPADDPADDRS